MKKLSKLDISNSQIIKDGIESDSKVIFCNMCCEVLMPADIEDFEKCPYCNNEIKINDDVEDMMLDPLVKEWTTIQNEEQHFKNSVL